MRTFLFSWNPDKWPWAAIKQDVEAVERGKRVEDKWNCSSYRTVRPGDRAFFVRVAHEPKGIFASGYIASEAFPEMSERSGKQIHRVKVVYDVLLDPLENMLTLDVLQMSDLRKQQWTPQSAGISIQPQLVDELEALWNDFLTMKNIKPRKK